MARSVDLSQITVDTLVAIAPPGTLGQASDIAMIVIAVVIVAFLGAALVLFRQISALTKKLDALATRATEQVAPTLDRVRAISEHVEYVSLAVRKDIRKVNHLVESVTKKVETASNRMEDRIAEFNALMEVVQDEAEQVFIGTASAVRGVRHGARALGAARRDLPPRSGPDSDEPTSITSSETDAVSNVPAIPHQEHPLDPLPGDSDE